MSVFDLFKFPRKRPRIVRTGSDSPSLIEYGEEAGLPRVGLYTGPKQEELDRRDEYFRRVFGECDKVYHETIPMIPHIDVHVFPTRHEDVDFFTLVTTGMSDLPMTPSPDHEGAPTRAELLMYVSEPRTRYIEVMRMLAHLPHDLASWFDYAHTVPNGSPPAPLFDEDSKLDTFVFMPPILCSDDELLNSFQIDGEPVRLLWTVPITTSECNLKLEQGYLALMDLFDDNEFSPVLSGDRESFI
jgi:hypothetical protein